MKKLLVTGGCGFVGSNLAYSAIAKGYKVYLFDNLSRFGSEKNKSWLLDSPNIEFVYGDIRNQNDIERCLNLVSPDVIFHLAGQVAMTTSLANPRMDFETNVVGTINLLEVVKNMGIDPLIIYSSTNKVYGDLEDIETEEDETRYSLPDFPNGLGENIGLDFRSPYGCSKGAADQYMLDYHRNYGLKTIVFRHSSIFGGRQFSTFDQGWIGWFVMCALRTKKDSGYCFTISGSGKQVRDVLFSDDLVDCYFSAVDNLKVFGQAFNIGGGFSNSLSLVELFAFLEENLDVKLNYETLDPRSSDQKVFIADTTKAARLFGWKPKITKTIGLSRMIDWVASNEL